MRIGIIGTGAMGSVYAGLLADAGNEVWAIDIWEAHVTAMGQHGLRVQGASGDRIVRDNLRVSTRAQDARDCELYIIATKAYDVDVAAASIRPILPPNATVLAMQNGLGSGERVRRVLPDANLLLGIGGGFGASMRAPGHVHHNGMAMLNIGESEGGLSNRLQCVERVWREAGFNTKVFADIDQLIWEKLICNCTFSAPCTVFDRNVREMLVDPETWRIALNCGVEAWAVAQAHGVTISFDDPERYLLDFAQGVLEAKPSMLQDHLARQRSEIGVINGAIPEMAARVGLTAPYNEVTSGIVRAREAEFDLA